MTSRSALIVHSRKLCMHLFSVISGSCIATSILDLDVSLISYHRSYSNFSRKKEMIDEACRAAASTHVGLDRNVIGPLSYVSGSISIGLLLGVPIDDRLMMRDAGTIFRNATTVSFEGNKSYSGRINLSAHSSTSDHSSLNEETDAFLRECWPNVESIDFFNIGCRACVKTILNALGPKLKRIHFAECSELDLLDLIPCTILEDLTIGVDCSIVTESAGPVYEYLNSQPFLPALKKFTSYSCLENWSSLFERKTSLTELRLNCSHVGIGELPRLEWSEIPILWKTVEKLAIGSLSGLTLTALAELFSQLPSLKDARMPYSITENEPEVRIEEVIQSLLESKKLLEFEPDFAVGYYWTECDFQDV